MLLASNQVLTVAQMRAAEEALIAAGSDAHQLMQRAGRGAADWVWRVAARRPVTVLCGPGNNGGDGYVIAQALRERNVPVCVVAAMEPATEAARNARALYHGEVLGANATPEGEVFVDCLFGSGLTRALSSDHAGLLGRLAEAHACRIAIDLPSGVESDHGMVLNDGLPRFQLTLALGAWKFAHFLMPATATMGTQRFVPIGIGEVAGAAQVLAKPQLHPPAADAHKYRRGLLAVVGGAMPGAAQLAAIAAQGAGAGYVKLFAEVAGTSPPDLVVECQPLAEAIGDSRIAAMLVGPGLGRDGKARERLAVALAADLATVADADALVLLAPRLLAERSAPLITTPHDGELVALERAFSCDAGGGKVERARALAVAVGAVVVAKGPDTVIAAPDGRVICVPRASSWLSTAGTGDVLAGAIASRLAGGVDAFVAACEGVWLHGAAAGLCPPAFTATQLAAEIRSAYAACL